MGTRQRKMGVPKEWNNLFLVLSIAVIIIFFTLFNLNDSSLTGGVIVDDGRDSLGIQTESGLMVEDLGIEAAGTEDAANWNKTYNLGGADYARSVTTDSNNNVYVVGYSSEDWHIKKFNSSGTEDSAWNKTYNLGSSDEAFSVTTDSNNNVYVVGLGASTTDWYIKKFNSSGTEDSAWNKTYNLGGADYAYSVATDSNNNVYVVGYGASTTDWHIKKFNSSGTEDSANWNKTYNLGDSDAAFSVTTDSNNNVYVVGYGASTYDWHIKKFNSSGTEDSAWNKTYNLGGPDYAYSVTTDSNNNVYVVGYGASTVDWHIKKFNSSGTEDSANWNKTYNLGDSDIARSVTTDSNNNVYVVGDGASPVDWHIKKFEGSPVSSNTAPNTTLVFINSTSVNNYTTDNITCYANVTDAEEATVFVNFTWYNNSVEVTSLKGRTNSVSVNNLTLISTLGSGNTTKGQNWTCSVQTDDLTVYEGDWNNASILIQNTIPVTSLATVASSDLLNRTNSTLIGSCNASDTDGDNVSYDTKWFKNSVLYKEPISEYIDGGGSHTCGILTNGSAYCWGLGSSGQLGNGGIAEQDNPTAVNIASSFKSISAGDTHTCGILTNGSAYCWGNGNFGRLGNGDTNQRESPATVSLDSTFKSISAGNAHTCGILTNGSAYCWGRGNYGRLGYGGTTQQDNPIAVNISSTMWPFYTQSLAVNIFNITYGLTAGSNWTLECTAWDATTASSALNSSTITIQNTAPVFDHSLATQTLNSSSTLTYDINCSDLDLDTITYFDNTSLFNINSSTGIIIDTPSHLEHGSHNITITCGDSQENVTSTFLYTINDIQSPTITVEGPLVPSSGNTTLNLTTNEAANCSYGTTSGNYTLMNFTSSVSHLHNLTSLTAGLKRYYFQCNDTSGNSATTDFTFLVTSTTSERSAVAKINATANNLVSTKPTTNVNLTFNLSSTSSDISVAVAEFNTSPETTSFAIGGSTTNAIKYITIEAPDIVSVINKITLKIDYNETEVAAAGIAEADLLVYYYNTTSGSWQQELESAVNTVSNYVEVNVTHLSTFVLGKAATTTVVATTTGGSSSSSGGNCALGYQLINRKCVKSDEVDEEKPASETVVVSTKESDLEVPSTDQAAASPSVAGVAPEESASFIGRAFGFATGSRNLKYTSLILLIVIITFTIGFLVYKKRSSTEHLPNKAKKLQRSRK